MVDHLRKWNETKEVWKCPHLAKVETGRKNYVLTKHIICYVFVTSFKKLIDFVKLGAFIWQLQQKYSFILKKKIKLNPASHQSRARWIHQSRTPSPHKNHVNVIQSFFVFNARIPKIQKEYNMLGCIWKGCADSYSTEFCLIRYLCIIWYTLENLDLQIRQ